MKKQSSIPGSRHSILWLALAAAFPLMAEAAPAARVDFAVGDARIQGPGGAVRPAVKGAEVNQGEVVDTGDGRVQLRFVDGAYISLQPQSQFRIDEFRYAGQPDGTEKGFFSLLKGGLRTITGLVGRANKSAYQVNTAVATIGIRGTEYAIQYGSGITGSVGEGEIAVCNAGGCLNVASGESFAVLSQDAQPRMTDKKTDLPPSQPPAAPVNFAQGENRQVSGESQFGALLTGAQFVNAAIAMRSSEGFVSLDRGTQTMEFDAKGDARAIDTCFEDCIARWTGPVRESGNDGIIAWGRWAGGSTTGEVINLTGGKQLHYVAGLPTTNADIQALRTANVTASYQLIGATAPSGPDGKLGTLKSATLSADFGISKITASVSVSYDGESISGTRSGTIQGNGLFHSTGSPTALSFEGFFAGPSASRAGMGYSLSAGEGKVMGSAAFARTGGEAK